MVDRGGYPAGVSDADFRDETVPFDEWLQDPTGDVIRIFEEDLLSISGEISAIAFDAITSQYKYASHGSVIWYAYWNIYNEWVENHISKDAMKELVSFWEDAE